MQRMSATLLVLFLLIISDSSLTTKAVNASVHDCKHGQDSLANISSDCVSFNFRFIELENYSFHTSTLKHVEVFLDEKAFSEENLRTLLGYLSTKHSSWKYLVVIVNTNWAQLGTFSNCLGTGISGTPDRPDEYDYYKAVMYRNGENQFFHYYPKLKSRESKTVISKGKYCWFTSPPEMCK